MRLVNQDEQRLISELERFGVLRKMDGHRLGDTVFCVCGDKDRRKDIFGFHDRKFREAHNGRSFDSQDVKPHGGPINLVYAPPDIFPLAVEREAVKRFCLYQLAVGLIAKDLARVDLVLHWPCGQLLLWGLDLKQSLEFFAASTEVVKRDLLPIAEKVAERAGKLAPSEIEVATHCHFDFGGEGEMQTWNFCNGLWAMHKDRVLAAVA